jgi:myo-inositol-1(or 4)-monophosphatase
MYYKIFTGQIRATCIIGEEAGLVRSSSEYTWIIDPLDGTSNFVIGIPWFGVQVALLLNGSPIMAAIYLPMNNVLHFAELNSGALNA